MGMKNKANPEIAPTKRKRLMEACNFLPQKSLVVQKQPDVFVHIGPDGEFQDAVHAVRGLV